MKCILCNSEDCEIILTTTDIRFHTTKNKYYLIKCNECGLVANYPKHTIDEIKNFYKTDYWQEEPSAIEKIINKLTYLEKISRISKYKIRGKVLDYGCGSGLFLEYLQKIGWTCYGVDVSETASNIAKEKNLSIYAKELTECDFSDNLFDNSLP